MKQNLNQKLELGHGRHTLLNRFIAEGKLKTFVEVVDILNKFNYDTSHYTQTYEKAKGYLKDEI